MATSFALGDKVTAKRFVSRVGYDKTRYDYLCECLLEHQKAHSESPGECDEFGFPRTRDDARYYRRTLSEEVLSALKEQADARMHLAAHGQVRKVHFSEEDTAGRYFTVIGKVMRWVGKYCSSEVNYTYWGDDDYSPAHLSNAKLIPVYLLRERLHHTIQYMALPGDMDWRRL